MKKYRTRSRITISGLELLIPGTLVSGIAIGFVLSLVAPIIYLVILFPILTGLIAGKILIQLLRNGKLSSPILAIVFSLLIAVLIYVTYEYFSYRTFLTQVGKNIAPSYTTSLYIDPKGKSPADLAIENFLIKSTGSDGLLGYVLLEAKEGVEIGKNYSSSTILLKGEWFWVYSLIELGIIAFVCLKQALSQTAIPLCEICNKWKDTKEWFGNVAPENTENFLALFNAGQFGRAGQLISSSSTIFGSLQIEVVRCQNCDTGEVVLAVNKLKPGRKKNSPKKETLLKGVMSPEEYRLFSQPVKG